MSTCPPAGHTFRIYREEWGEHTTHLAGGKLFEGPQKHGECTELTINCTVCGYAPELTQQLDVASGELVWVADPYDAEEETRLRAAGFTLTEHP